MRELLLWGETDFVCSDDMVEAVCKKQYLV